MSPALHHPLRCRCGQVQGRVDPRGTAGHGRCYCRYCQAYARWLGRPEETLDARGGTEILVGTPDAVRLDAGHEHLAAVRLSRRGPLRWYAACCRTALGNTPGTRAVPYIGLVRDCLPGPDDALATAFGPASIVVNGASANPAPPPASTPLALVLSAGGLVRRMLASRLRGRYRANPFFAADGAPIATPRALSADEKAALGLVARAKR